MRVAELVPDAGSVGITAIDKREVAGPVKVRSLGLYADVQCDRAHHGGENKALYAYSQGDADYWSAELGYEVRPGLFGENLRLDGMDASEALFGERWLIGESVEVEVTMPRTPCATFARHVGESSWVKRFAEQGRTGAYLRVLKTGSIQAGDAVHRVHVPEHGVSLKSWFMEPSLSKLNALRSELGEHLVPEITSMESSLRQRESAE